MNPLFGNTFGFDPTSLLTLGSIAGFGPGLQNAMGQIWQVNQANQQASLYDNYLQQQQDMLNSQLSAAQNMQGKQLQQSQENAAIGALAQLYGQKQMGGILNNLMGSLGGMFGGGMGGLGGYSPMSFKSNSGAGVSFGAPGGAAPGGGAGGMSGAFGGIDWSNPANISPLYHPAGNANPGYGAGVTTPGDFRAAYRPGELPSDPSGILMNAITTGKF